MSTAKFSRFKCFRFRVFSAIQSLQQMEVTNTVDELIQIVLEWVT
jgi:hypothetical protein